MPEHAMTRVGYVGNFVPEHSTENHVRQALEHLGVEVVQLQENGVDTWPALAAADVYEFDLVMWTRTWHLPEEPQAEALTALHEASIPVVAYHLDRWWGLNREHQVEDEPYFGADLVVTAEGGVRDRWLGAGVEHVWFPPAVLEAQAVVGRRVPRWRADVAFVGSWAGYHEEWPWRRQLIRWLPRQYGMRARLYPRHPAQRIVGRDLSDLYASVRVIVGDSCLAPYGDQPCTHYWSDRVPETLGRAGFLIHPWVEGIEDHYVDGEHLILVEPQDLGALQKAIDWWTDPDHDAERLRIAHSGRRHVLEHHTYEVRMRQLADLLQGRGML